MSQSNIGVFTDPKHELYVKDVDMPGDPAPDEVTIRVRATGICGSDVHFWKAGKSGKAEIKEPLILGHESAGEVVKVGSAVTDLKEGDRVSIEPGKSCGVCIMCTSGKYNLCPKMEFKSTPGVPGLLRRYVNHAARLCHKMPDNLTYEEGALLEPFSVSLSGVLESGIQLGDAVLICGAGPVGLLAAMAAKTAGASPIVISDVTQGRLDSAKKLIPSIRTVLTDPNGTPEDTSKKLIDAAGTKFRVCLECTGFESSINGAILAIEPSGICQLIGVSAKDYVNFPFTYVSEGQISIKGVFRYANTWPRGLRLFSEGLIDAKPLVTHKFPLEEAQKAFETSSDPKSGALKVIITNDK